MLLAGKGGGGDPITASLSLSLRSKDKKLHFRRIFKSAVSQIKWDLKQDYVLVGNCVAAALIAASKCERQRRVGNK